MMLPGRNDGQENSELIRCSSGTKNNVYVECSSIITIDFRLLPCIDENSFDSIGFYFDFFSPYCPSMIRLSIEHLQPIP